MSNRQLVAHSPAAAQCQSRRVRTALASVTRSCMMTFILAASGGLTAAQTPQIDSQPTTRAHAVSAVIDSEIKQIRGVLLCSAILSGSSTPAAEQKSDLDGTYTLDDADSDNIAKAIEDAVGKLNFLTRHIARDRLKKLNPAYRRVAIASSPNEISVSVDDQQPLHAPAKGTPVAWAGPDGGKVNVSMQLAGRRLVQTFNSAEGRRVNDYTLSPDGRMLTMQVTETSPRLSQAIRYKQVYRRVS